MPNCGLAWKVDLPMNTAAATTPGPAAPDPKSVETIMGGRPTQLALALRRLRDEKCSVDPQSAVARFNSAF